MLEVTWVTMEARGQLERERQQAGGSGEGVEREGGDGREDCDCSQSVRSYAYMQNLKKHDINNVPPSYYLLS